MSADCGPDKAAATPQCRVGGGLLSLKTIAVTSVLVTAAMAASNEKELPLRNGIELASARARQRLQRIVRSTSRRLVGRESVPGRRLLAGQLAGRLLHSPTETCCADYV